MDLAAGDHPRQHVDVGVAYSYRRVADMTVLLEPLRRFMMIEAWRVTLPLPQRGFGYC
jgi:hypothetical protein